MMIDDNNVKDDIQIQWILFEIYKKKKNEEEQNNNNKKANTYRKWYDITSVCSVHKFS